ncbi:MAG: winged helix-turn-helix domain-containing protein [Sulfolobaceae archaeon]|jgi:DNA-binding transcriptional ArsR family regulator|nr:winged helix-turn-helix domain-containing protein [Sulfolobales archaeon]MCQ4345736.1 winged helix-turn-helix domain-containing protein [Sulfolobales archaeon]MCQ4384765.1 winged helix-turn-helix domain-containing protein [Sulfolobales archaeon]MCQ4406693.1 winged helix-turn-helix domain-containing protein [Sulfolobales archaeon]MDT7905327.1 winged helix-turn-helix domain-containing protein [Sulfolobales archaeon]
MPILKLEEMLNSEGQSTRIQILKLLLEKPRTPYEISKLTGLNYSTVRYHLDLMQRFGLVKANKNGKILYTITKDGVNLIIEREV